MLVLEQSEFRKQNSTNDNLTALQTEIHNAFANKQKCIGVFFHIQRAFDKAWQLRILQELIEWNIRGNMIHLLKTF